MSKMAQALPARGEVAAAKYAQRADYCVSAAMSSMFASKITALKRARIDRYRIAFRGCIHKNMVTCGIHQTAARSLTLRRVRA